MESFNIYQNGTYLVTINSKTGTKKYTGQEFVADFPDSLDIKITEKCNYNCPFCHESSVKSGEHGDLLSLIPKLRGLPKGVELAIGGGNALLHPGLEEFLQMIKDHFNVAITIHWKDLINEESVEILKRLISDDKRLITSIGISLANIKKKDLDIIKEEVFSSMFGGNIIFSEEYRINYVFHIIPGITSPKIFKQILWDPFSFQKILILGYKQFGRAENTELPINDLEDWRKHLKEYYNSAKAFYKNHKTIAFDNLALEQLNIREFFTTEYWNENYMGNEFTHSMYVDACKGEYAPTSRSPHSERTSWNDKTIIEYFKENHL